MFAADNLVHGASVDTELTGERFLCKTLCGQPSYFKYLILCQFGSPVFRALSTMTPASTFDETSLASMAAIIEMRSPFQIAKKRVGSIAVKVVCFACAIFRVNTRKSPKYKSVYAPMPFYLWNAGSPVSLMDELVNWLLSISVSKAAVV